MRDAEGRGVGDRLARYVHPPLVKAEPVDCSQHGHPQRIGLESAGGKRTGMKVTIWIDSKVKLEQHQKQS